MSVFDIDYDKAHAWVKKHFKRRNREGTYTSIHLKNAINKTKNGYKLTTYGYSPSDKYMTGYGFKKNQVLVNPKYKKQTGYTLASFIENHREGRYFVIVKGHAFAVIDGKLYGNPNEGNYQIHKRVQYVLEAK